MRSELKRKLDYSDLLVSPDDGKRYELMRGDLHVTPSPSPMHQRISKRLQRQLEAYFEDRSIGEVFDAPIDLILTKQDVFVPDLLVVADSSHVTKRGIEGPPGLHDLADHQRARIGEGAAAGHHARCGALEDQPHELALALDAHLHLDLQLSAALENQAEALVAVGDAIEGVAEALSELHARRRCGRTGGIHRGRLGNPCLPGAAEARGSGHGREQEEASRRGMFPVHGPLVFLE